ncbi:MAG: bifunctional glycosyltransferase family 2/GtrA family protein [Lachnospiraceae bacterium]|nr:bifunctional glycosyltransferase family 2/GtrA family protein [Lachnospiraceae bacterium]
MEKLCIPLVIPVYEPDERFLSLLENIKESDIRPVIIVNDGSGEKYERIFLSAERMMEGEDFYILSYEENRGKGYALKTAFTYVLVNYKDAIGVVTADSDGQHTCESIEGVRKALAENPECLVLGCRDFEDKKRESEKVQAQNVPTEYIPQGYVPTEHIPQGCIPWKSRFGNRITKKVFAYVSGIELSDTQTGLRGIPTEFMKELIRLESDRFEFEMQMILEAAGKKRIVEVPIPMIYDSVKNHQTHFRPVVDSVKIYRILCRSFFRYTFSSLSSSILDLLFFQILCSIIRNRFQWYVAVATGIARVISAIYNYTMNNEFVFRSQKRKKISFPRYALLALVQMACSAFLVTVFVILLPMLPELLIKIVVDTGLFFLSYKIQQKYIF